MALPFLPGNTFTDPTVSAELFVWLLWKFAMNFSVNRVISCGQKKKRKGFEFFVMHESVECGMPCRMDMTETE